MKRLVACCDGTWNTPDERDEGEETCTNVTRVALAVAARDRGGTEQRLFYDKGVGTGRFDHFRGGALGVGLSKKVQDAYMFLVENYDVGDEVFLFGFSRGAYTARSVAGFIRNSGLLTREHADKLGAAYELYRDRSDASHPRAMESVLFRKSFAQEIRIKFIGVWDTVGALGIPALASVHAISKRWEFHDVKLSSYVDYAFQAIAIDERRKPFEPTLWEQQPHAVDQTLEQVWFSGVHTNIGGGYCDRGLSDLALAWMIDRATRCGLALDTVTPPLEPNALGEIRNSMTWSYRMLGEGRRPIGVPRVDDKGEPVETHEAVAASAVARWNADASYRPANLGAYLARGGKIVEVAATVTPPGAA